MIKITALVSKLKCEFSILQYDKLIAEQYALKCFIVDEEELNNLYLEIILLEGLQRLCLNDVKLNKLVLRNYKSIYNPSDLFDDLLDIKINNNTIVNNTIQIVQDNWDQIDW